MEPTYHLVAHGIPTEPARVTSFRARETMSACYEISLECVADASRDLVTELLGRRASLILNITEPPEAFHGFIHSVSLLGHGYATVSGERIASATYAIGMSPRLWVLKKKRRSRVFQRRRVDEIVQEILADANIPTLWLLQRALPVREYCTQYEETDEEFIRRILAEAGVMFYFLQPALPKPIADIASILDTVLAALKGIPGLGDFLGGLGAGSITGEVLVFADDPLAYYGIGDMPEGLDSLIQTAVNTVGNEIAKATGEVGATVMAATRELVGMGIAAAGASRTLHFIPPGDALQMASRDVVRKLAVHHSVESQAVVFSTFDPHRPLRPLSFSASGDGPIGQAADLLTGLLPAEVAGAVGTAAQVVGTASQVVGAVAKATGQSTGPLGDALGVVDDITRQIGGAVGKTELTVHEHHDPFLFPDFEYARLEPRKILAGERRDRRVGRGESLTPLLSCGRRFTLADHPVDSVNREYVVTEVVHHGRAVTADSKLVYENEFACVPSDVTYLPLRPRRRTVQTCLTATVIAPDSHGEMQTRGMAEIKVRFHWDEPQTGTCWVRTMQTWSGVGWGTQFLPRVGMEVVVGFDGGDPDRPIVLGCLYNAVHPAPFALPGEQTRSGIRTHSTPNGEGHNELSFEDRQGSERFYMHAERNLDIEVEHDRTAVIQHDDALLVEHDRRAVVTGAESIRVDGGQDIVVREHRRLEVEGTDEHVTRGHRNELIIGSLTTEVRGIHRSSYGGGAGESIDGDFTRQTTGCVTELVRRARIIRVEGSSDMSSVGPTQIESDEEVVLRCGDSTIRVAKDCIELTSPKILMAAEGSSMNLESGAITQLADGAWKTMADSALVASSGASVGLSSEAKVDGSQILLNSPDKANDSVEEDKVEPTVIELTDRNGKPIPHQRYRIELGDGTARTGKLDDKGRASVRIEGSAEVIFPDLAEVSPS